MSSASPEEPVPEVPETEWRRLDARMLLIHPVETVIRLLPALLALLVARANSDSDQPWELYALPVIVAFGVLRWFTTRYRITGGRIELQRGLLNKQTTKAQLDKVRTVDLTARVYHRVLGLAKVEISTGGSHRDRLVLDSLRVDEGRRLRAELLHRIDPAVTGLPTPTGLPVSTDASGPDASAPAPHDEELVRLDPAWVRYAPFTLTGIATAAAGVGFLFQSVGRVRDQGEVIASGTEWVRGLAIWVDVLLLLVVVSVLAAVAYVLNFWGFRLTRNRLGSLHTRRGLLTTRETSIDRGRVRGVQVDEPAGLRLVGARRLKVVTTGLLRERGGADWLVPPAPATEVFRVATGVVDDDDAVTAALQPHGRAALRRRLTRTIVPTLVVLVALAVLRSATDAPVGWFAGAPVLLALAAWLAVDRYAGLGHRITPRHLVVREGSLDRHRVALDRDGVIGWTVRQSFFQRRAGVATLVATTAAGASHYDVVDVPVARAYEVMGEVSPDLLAEFR
ncbi:PH domain-containing protein [Intrasporangium flavum]|uniref:PH domain-containing protein n=1 Tax=Intrasporangium flavum TaxID=1428657 RepID=UPI001F61E4D6|nr:PH domain-containing protein [Intrasporangium flavum]